MSLTKMRKRSSSLALAIALATGSAIVATAVYPAEAQAQRKKKNDKAQAAAYSEAFVAAFNPVNEALGTEGTDVAAYKPQLTQLGAMASSPDEKMAAGGLIYNSAVKLSDQTMQLRGMELMLESGKVHIDKVGQYNFIAYQLANAQKDFPKSRNYLQAAINSNFSTADIGPSDLQVALSESYFADSAYTDGLATLSSAIEARKSSGQPVAENWYKRGLTVAYNNKIQPQVYDYATMWIGDYASPANWRDVVNLTRNLGSYDQQQTLDLLRLSRAANALTDKNDYSLYVETADPRLLPQEVKNVIDEAYASEAVSRDDIFISDSLTTATGRIASDKSDLPALERDANATGAKLTTVYAAANAFYSYGQYAKAAPLFEKALAMPGVNRAEALTRLGMAQVGLGNYSAASESFAQVDGTRAPIAKLWAAYAAQQAASAGTM